MNFEELVESLGLDEPEIIDYNSGAEFGGLTEEQINYILSEFINGRPVYIMVSQSGDSGGSVAPSSQSSNDFICTDTVLQASNDQGVALVSVNATQIMGSNIFIALLCNNSVSTPIDQGGVM